MKVLLEYCCKELTVKNSRFIAEMFPVNSQNEAREKLREQKLKYRDATHVVHAFIAGKNAEVSGMSDDGEPGGTAGRPVLDVLKGSGITDCILTVTRYFGGTLLGTGGLVHAYGDSAKLVISSCKTEEYVPKVNFSFNADYGLYETIKRIYSEFHLEKLHEEYGSGVSVSGTIWESEKNDFLLRLKNLSNGKILQID